MISVKNMEDFWSARARPRFYAARLACQAVHLLAAVAVLSSGTLLLTAAVKEKPLISQKEDDYARDNIAVGKLTTSNLQVSARELSIRGGIPSFIAKAKAGKPVIVAYFGGSITAHEGWRPRSFEGIQKMFPDCKMTMVPASVGGTGSIVGLFRADRDLVKCNPDLVFIEFAVNDGGDAVRRTRDVIRSLEGIILKLRKTKPDTDICFFYTMQTQDVETVKKGLAQPAVCVHEQVASHYNLPSIYIGPAIVKAIDKGFAVFKGKVADKTTGKDADGKLVITEDSTHPVIPAGHAFYADVVLSAFKTLASSPATPTAATALPKPIFGDTWERAKTIPADGNAKFDGKWEKLTAKDGPACFRFGRRFYDWIPFLYRTDQAGASATIRFKGTMIGVKGVNGPDSGIVSVKVDDQPERNINNFSVYNTGSFYAGDILPELIDGEHIAKFTLSAEKPDKGKILASYYRKDNDRDFKEHPEKYAPCRFSIGEIVIIGEIVK